MIDARIIVDELIVECEADCDEPEARRLGEAIARAFASQLQQIQTERLRSFRRSARPTALHLERVVVRLADPRVSAAAIGRSLRDALDSARRRQHA